MQTLAAMCRGGAYKLDPAFVNALKANYKAITAGVSREWPVLESHQLIDPLECR